MHLASCVIGLLIAVTATCLCDHRENGDRRQAGRLLAGVGDGRMCCALARGVPNPTACQWNVSLGLGLRGPLVSC